MFLSFNFLNSRSFRPEAVDHFVEKQASLLSYLVRKENIWVVIIDRVLITSASAGLT